MKQSNLPHWLRHATPRAIACLVLGFVGVGGLKLAAAMKKPPAEVERKERPLSVEAVKAVAEDVTVTITGHGEVMSLATIPVAAEVAGRIVEIHARLEDGVVVPEGQILFRIDARDYRAALDEASAAARQAEASIDLLRRRQSIDADRLKTVQRNCQLASNQLERVRQLLHEDDVGSVGEVERIEQAYNSATDQADRLAGAVSLYPVQILEAQTALKAASARVARAEANLARCEVTAPFNARVKACSLEAGQYVSPGQTLLKLADDSVLEIRVPLDSRDVRKWLMFDRQDETNGTGSWFSKVEPVACTIRWTESKEDHIWEGHLDRVVDFDTGTRMVTVAVRVDGANGTGPLPLVEGMFCQVQIPGATMRNVFRVPRWAVTMQNEVYVANSHHLKTVPVTVAHVDGPDAFLTGGVAEGDTVIVTRLVDPLEHSLLDVKFRQNGEGEVQP
jgi:multidrug efflux pump subunit AcrA (membrane-fusion protein)